MRGGAADVFAVILEERSLTEASSAARAFVLLGGDWAVSPVVGAAGCGAAASRADRRVLMDARPSRALQRRGTRIASPVEKSLRVSSLREGKVLGSIWSAGRVSRNRFLMTSRLGSMGPSDKATEVGLSVMGEARGGTEEERSPP